MRGGLLVKEARLRAGLTQTELAERLGTRQPVVARWETGAAEPAFATVVEAVRACDLELQVGLVRDDGSDRDLAVANTHVTPEQRLEQLRGMLEFERLAQRTSRAARRD